MVKLIDSSLSAINQNQLSTKPYIAKRLLPSPGIYMAQEVVFERMVDSVKQLGMGKQGLIGCFKFAQNRIGHIANLIASTDLKQLGCISDCFIYSKEKMRKQPFSLIR
jgi:hypothetical protein